MRAAAPGKLILSGAYAVLFGAPAIVAAVDRYVMADTSKRPDFVTPEVREALGQAPAPAFDASELRADNQKLGLGSSAAILVASLAATLLEKDPTLDDSALRQAVFEPSRAAHRRAQGGGSGVDVAAAAFGGVLSARLRGDSLQVEPAKLPPDLVIEVWFSGQSASTPELVGRVLALKQASASSFESLLAAQTKAAKDARDAVHAADANGVVGALDAQVDALDALGQAATAPIIPDSVRALRELARRHGATTLPSGAGGGDSVLYVGKTPASEALVELRDDFGYRPLNLKLGARGVHAVT